MCLAINSSSRFSDHELDQAENAGTILHSQRKNNRLSQQRKIASGVMITELFSVKQLEAITYNCGSFL